MTYRSDRDRPAQSTCAATLWLARYHPERLSAWLARHNIGVAIWLRQARPDVRARLTDQTVGGTIWLVNEANGTGDDASMAATERVLPAADPGDVTEGGDDAL